MRCILIYYLLGENCETLLAPCSPKPCKNGGVCKESEDYESFSCVCPEGWQGTNFTNLTINSVLASILSIITIFIFCNLPSLQAKHVRWTLTNVSKTLVEMTPSVRTLLAATNAVANQATLAATVRRTLMTASPVSVLFHPYFDLVQG